MERKDEDISKDKSKKFHVKGTQTFHDIASKKDSVGRLYEFRKEYDNLARHMKMVTPY